MSDQSAAQPTGQAFWADDPIRIWRVTSGGVDLFLQRRIPTGEPQGPRHHLLRIFPNQVFWGLAERDWGMIAVPLPGTWLGTSDQAWLQQNEPDTEGVRLCEQWISATVSALSRPPAPRLSVLAAPGSRLTLARDETLGTTDPLVWIEILDGTLLWMAQGIVTSGLLPLSRELWLKADGPARIRTTVTADLLGDGRLWSALANHHRLVVAWIIETTHQLQAQEKARLALKAQRSLDLTCEALQCLLETATSQGPHPTTRIHSGHTSHEGCLAACQALGQVLGIEFRLPHPAEFAAMDRLPVAAIAAASRVRYRRVILRGDWWRGDQGPLLALRDEGDEDWVALLPCYQSYEVFDPATDETQPVTEAFAARLKPMAILFYRTLPDKGLGLADLMVFALRGRQSDLSLVLTMGVLGGLLGLAIPVATGVLLDTLIPSADLGGIWQVTGALASSALATALFEVSRALAVLRIESKMDIDLQAALWDRVLRLPAGFFRRYAVGDLALRINGITSIRRELSRATLSSLLTGVFSIFSYGLLFYFSVALAGMATVLVLVAMLTMLGIGYAKLTHERRLSEAGGQLQSLVFQYLSGIVKLRVGSAEPQAFANWAKHFSAYRRMQFQAQHWANVGKTFLSGYSTLALAGLFAVMGGWIAEGSTEIPLSTGAFIAFTAAFGTFFAGMLSLSETLLGLLNLVPLYERAKPILETLPESDSHKTHPGELQGSIEVSRVSFRYGNGPDILKDVSFSIPPGSLLALVGPSGSGKSTLFRLLLGFETPVSGSIFYDSQDLATLDIQAVRRQLGVVLQNGQLIAGDILTNIVGTSGLGLEAAREATQQVGLDTDIEQMPMGMHTLIAEGVSTLSGGQRQRILIARAIVNRPRILFLDEATSALDNRTQEIVTRSLDQLKATRIVIAHRLSTIIHADHIIVLHNGEIVQTGTYDTLVNQPGLFAELAKRQMA
ncbi:NHLP bacteriocin export ABC transporter permease/ATPase subunit [Gammaproteobacteria bacterium]